MPARAAVLKRWVFAALVMIGSLPLAALVVSRPDSAAEGKAYRHPELHIPNVYIAAKDLPESIAANRLSDLQTLDVGPEAAYIDERTGRWGTLMPATPLLPGGGTGNSLTWSALGVPTPDSPAELRDAALTTLLDYLRLHQAELAFDLSEFLPARITSHGTELIQVHIPRRVDGVAVRDTYLTAVINHGNLILLGSRNWADVDVARAPTADPTAAWNTLLDYLAGIVVEATWRQPHLTLVPMAQGSFLERPAFGQGTRYRLAWVLSPHLVGERGRWEALVDAHTLELLSFADTHHYATTRSVVGGVYPNSNDGVPPDGVEQPFWPMPFADVTTAAGEALVTDAGGNLLACVDDEVSTTLSGPYVNINDTCGDLLEASSGTINLGVSGGTDCTTPPGASAGNTHASRSVFYALNRIKEQARVLLPENPWLKGRLTANVNLDSSCGASWNGREVSFDTSGFGCGNTGELAGVVHHEWGHGMDASGVNDNLSNPTEGIADVYAALHLNDSCIGRGFFMTGNCSGYGDACLDCSGVRDLDWQKRVSGEPHDLDFVFSNCGSGTAPCGGIIHCEAALYAEAVWDLFNRDLPAEGRDFGSSLELATRLTYDGAGPVGSWYNCDRLAGTGDGCNADGGYLNYLAADDDNGDLNDGTPHMTAIATAFSRHGIACSTPPPVDNGCDHTPTEAPEVEATAIDRGVSLSWSAVAGAAGYEVFRTDGVLGCDYSKIKVGETLDTVFVDNGLANGRDYFYTVAASGSGRTCLGPMSACTSVNPDPGPNLTVSPQSAALTTFSGDGDEFIDNCEQAALAFDVVNIGSGALSDVEIVGITSLSHPGVVITSELPIAVTDRLPACGVSESAFEFIPQGLEFKDTLRLRVELTAAELDGVVKVVELELSEAETDFEVFLEKSFVFEEGAEGWTAVSGTFERLEEAGGGAKGTDAYMASSSFLGDQCDQIVSPLMRLTEKSTLSLYSNFDIEPFSGQAESWYDRANVGITDSSSRRTPIEPDGGQAYNASGDNGTCGTEGQSGFADAMPTWEESRWSSDALMAPDFAGQLVQLSVHYGTDPVLEGFGFRFDEIVMTDVDLQVEDLQSNTCDLSDDPMVTLTGSCPGSVTLSFENGTPGGEVRIYQSPSPGRTTVQTGTCSGLMLALTDASQAARATLDADGAIVITHPAAPSQCGHYLQAVDVATCEPTEVARVPN